MKKRDLIEAIKNLGDDEEVVIALTYPKPDEGFEIGEDDDATENTDGDSPDLETDDDEDDDGVMDNEDGTMTEVFDITSIDVTEYVDEETNKPTKLASLVVDMLDEDDDEEGDDDDADE